MVFSIHGAAAGGVVITKPDTFAWRDAHQILLSGVSRQEDMVFESSSLGWTKDCHSQIFGATDEYESLEAPIEVLRRGTHIDEDDEERIIIAQAHSVE